MSRRLLILLSLALVCLCNSENGVQARMLQQHAVKRDLRVAHEAQIERRQLLGGAGDTGTDQPDTPVQPVAGGPASASTVPASADTAPASESSPLDSLLDPVTGGLSSVSSVIATRLSSALSSLATSASSSVRSSSVEEEESSTRQRPTQSVINVTSTALIQPSDSAPSSSATAEAQKDDDSGGGGINKMTMIIIIAVASSVGLIAAAWTIFRKWKLSPSRQFDDRLNPIAWTPDMPHPQTDDKLALTRSNSDGSGVSSLYKGSAVNNNLVGATPLGPGHLRRAGSWGSAHGSAYGSRQDMSEVGYAQPAMQPAYPPANPYAPPYPDHGYQQRMPSPYEQVSRQQTFNGGRYGEGYGSAAGSIRR